jgi:hypothetical protein
VVRQEAAVPTQLFGLRLQASHLEPNQCFQLASQCRQLSSTLLALTGEN